jgi:hypothetical protein
VITPKQINIILGALHDAVVMKDPYSKQIKSILAYIFVFKLFLLCMRGEGNTCFIA